MNDERRGMGAAAVLVLVLALPATTAVAAPPGAAAPSARVSLGGLDLRRNADAAVAYQRLKVASRRVCATLDAPGVQGQRAWRDCYDSALLRAVEASGSPSLARLHGAGPAPLPLARRDGR